MEGVLVTRAMDNAIRELNCPNRVKPQNDEESKAYAMAFSVAGLMITALRWFKSGFDMTAAQLAEIAVNLVTKPLFDPDFA